MARDEPIGGELLTLAEAAKTLPHRVDGSTLWRWWKRGIRESHCGSKSSVAAALSRGRIAGISRRCSRR